MTPDQAYEAYGSKAAAARALNMPVSTFKDHLRRGGKGSPKSRGTVLSFPALPDPKEPIDKLIKRRTEHYNRQKAHNEAATWQQIKVSDNKPFGLAVLGDPHLDDDGCAWKSLLDDVAVLRETEGLFAVNIGDSANSWVGRLARLYGSQETSKTSAAQLVEWFLLHAGIKWLAVLLGNHDLWQEDGAIIKRMCASAKVSIPVHEWAARIELAFPNGARCRASLAHDFRGRSIYSTTHGPLREAIWNQDGAHILAAGHIHYGGLQQVEIPGGHAPWLVRVRGYKDHDSFALHNGFHEGQRFRSAVAIIDPTAPEHERCMMFPSIKQGAAVLTAMRSQSPARKPRRRNAA